MKQDLCLGIDIGTSGVRAVATDAGHQTVAYAATPMPAPSREGVVATQDAIVWWEAIVRALDDLGQRCDFSQVRAISADGTSGTIVPIDGAGRPLAPASMYNDGSATAAANLIAAVAPPETAAHGVTSPLGRALSFQSLPGVARILHQADWALAQFSGRFGLSDENNALKTGYDPEGRRWPDWVQEIGIDPALLPEVLPVGTALGEVTPAMRARFGFASDAIVVSGTTDGCAAFLATGADRIGDGVTSLGTTLVVKFLSDTPIFAAQYGVYSHRIGDLWLAGGASNSGGAALLKFFTASEMAALEADMRTDEPTKLEFYPLQGVGERFPIYDPAMTSRVSPRPEDDARFLQALLEGVAEVEALAYARMVELGAPELRRVFSVGGGSKNAAWTRIRERRLGVASSPPQSDEAAVGAARLAWHGLRGVGR